MKINYQDWFMLNNIDLSNKKKKKKKKLKDIILNIQSFKEKKSNSLQIIFK